MELNTLAGENCIKVDSYRSFDHHQSNNQATTQLKLLLTLIRQKVKPMIIYLYTTKLLRVTTCNRTPTPTPHQTIII